MPLCTVYRIEVTYHSFQMDNGNIVPGFDTDPLEGIYKISSGMFPGGSLETYSPIHVTLIFNEDIFFYAGDINVTCNYMEEPVRKYFKHEIWLKVNRK